MKLKINTLPEPLQLRLGGLRNFFGENIYPEYPWTAPLFPEPWERKDYPIQWPDIQTVTLVDSQTPYELAESESRFTLVAAIPGIDKNNIDIKIEENTVIITAECATNKTEEDKSSLGEVIRSANYACMRTCYIKCNIPVEIDADLAKATYKDGILTLVLPKRNAQSKISKKIAVD